LKSRQFFQSKTLSDLKLGAYHSGRDWSW